jgi:hypothetical protein
MDSKNERKDIAWFVLFDEEYENIPDPNKPENIPYMKAKQKERAENLRRFYAGQGKVLFDSLKMQLKTRMMALLYAEPEKQCLCPVCALLREARSRLDLLVEAESILSEKE